MLARSDTLSQSAEYRRRLGLILLVAGVVIALDHLSKWWISHSLAVGASIPLGGIVSITHVENSGAAFGLFSGFQYLYIVVAAIVAVYIVLAGPKFGSNLYRQTILGAILGGAVANGVDRLIFGHVTDFIDFHFWPVFNVADSAIVVAMVLAVFTIRDSKPAEPVT